MKLKPFDLQKALAGDQVVYRDGTPASEIFYSIARLHSGYQPVISIDVDGSARYHNIDGTYTGDNIGNPCDLFMAPKKVKYYFATWANNTVRDTPGRFATNLYLSVDLLMNTHRMTGARGTDYLIHEIEIEE